jgi:mxaA protein
MNMRVGLILALLIYPAWGIASEAVVQQPRPFGYVLGDTLTQRILLESADHNPSRPVAGTRGSSFDPAVLPPAERASLWFFRRSARIELSEDKHRWLVIDYQVINAPQALTTVNLPSLTLKSRTGTGELTVREWPISISPLTPRTPVAKGGLQMLRPDHPAHTLPTRELRLQLTIWLTALVLTLLGWLSWWLIRSIRAAATQPFAQALREIRRTGDDDGAGTWLALHRAFDRTAHCTLQLSTLPALFKQAPHFQAERAAIERFYTESYRRFFATTDSSPPERTESLRALCMTLRRIEKQYER